MKINKFYDNENTDITLFYDIEGTPNSSHLYEGDFRGDVARILFYMATRYDFLELNDDMLRMIHQCQSYQLCCNGTNWTQ